MIKPKPDIWNEKSEMKNSCSYYQTPYYGQQASQLRSTGTSRFGGGGAAEDSTSSSYRANYFNKIKKTPKDDESDATSPPYTIGSTYYSQFERRNSLGRNGSTVDDEASVDDVFADTTTSVRPYGSYNRKASDRYSSSGSSYLKNRLAKSRSSHAIGNVFLDQF